MLNFSEKSQTLVTPPAYMSYFVTKHHELEVEASDRESRRIAALSAKMRERAERFQDARLRTNGRDEAALAAQIAEKEEAKRALAASKVAEGWL